MKSNGTTEQEPEVCSLDSPTSLSSFTFLPLQGEFLTLCSLSPVLHQASSSLLPSCDYYHPSPGMATGLNQQGDAYVRSTIALCSWQGQRTGMGRVGLVVHPMASQVRAEWRQCLCTFGWWFGNSFLPIPYPGAELQSLGELPLDPWVEALGQWEWGNWVPYSG